jgi:hypothetical protein
MDDGAPDVMDLPYLPLREMAAKRGFNPRTLAKACRASQCAGDKKGPFRKHIIAYPHPGIFAYRFKARGHWRFVEYKHEFANIEGDAPRPRANP